MALKYNVAGSPIPTSSAFQLAIFGDGASTVLTVNLQNAPLSLNLNGNMPISATGEILGAPTGTFSLNGDRKSITFTFSSAIAVGSSVNALVGLLYNGQ